MDKLFAKLSVYDLCMVCIGLLLLGFFYAFIAHPQMMDDANMYQGFSEELVEEGTLNFAKYYGFQGQALFTAPFYWLTGRADSILWVTSIFAFLSVPLAYLGGMTLGGTRSSGTLFMLAVLSMPLVYVTGLRGFVEPIQFFWMILLLYFLSIHSSLAYLAFAIILVIKPWGLAFLPSMLYLTYERYYERGHIGTLVKGIVLMVSSFVPIVLHAVLTYLQTGYYANAWSAGAKPNTSLSFSALWVNWGRYLETFLRGQDPGGILWVPVSATSLCIVYLIQNIPRDLQEKQYTTPFLIISLLFNLFLVGLCPWFFHKYFLSAYLVMLYLSFLLFHQYPVLRFVFFIGSYSVFTYPTHANYLSPLVSSETFFAFTGLQWMWLIINVIVIFDYFLHTGPPQFLRRHGSSQTTG
ncbi:hypothetical protein GF339_23245 [candidate division KSB3 bacterium]|uniref:Uncharacterized protein n=1 Tax=candidate division KSB3 bacterium TaxID=2044937 RepID=A0A9D5K0G0_9BACT|nr:hypothetical protein [candidate division KSB3 bacterium]MBD3327520.1 hypothetical protein [candidate division KSB3 bacterium]